MQYLADVRSERIDPRDARWESGEPAYRVYFWTPRGDGWASEEWRLRDADVAEVLAWTDDNAQGRRVVIWVEHDDGRDGLGLIRLQGWEPTCATMPPPWTR